MKGLEAVLVECLLGAVLMSATPLLCRLHQVEAVLHCMQWVEAGFGEQARGQGLAVRGASTGSLTSCRLPPHLLSASCPVRDTSSWPANRPTPNLTVCRNGAVRSPQAYPLLTVD